MEKKYLLHIPCLLAGAVMLLSCHSQKEAVEQNGSKQLAINSSFKFGAISLDEKGERINAHGGGKLFRNRTYYSYGEVRGKGASRGVNVYSSKDLYSLSPLKMACLSLNGRVNGHCRT